MYLQVSDIFAIGPSRIIVAPTAAGLHRFVQCRGRFAREQPHPVPYAHVQSLRQYLHYFATSDRSSDGRSSSASASAPVNTPSHRYRVAREHQPHHPEQRVRDGCHLFGHLLTTLHGLPIVLFRNWNRVEHTCRRRHCHNLSPSFRLRRDLWELARIP